MVPHSRTWFAAWVDSAYGDQGFWPHHRPQQQFRTAAGRPTALATVVAALLDRRPEITAVVDVGCGAGELLTGLRALRPRLELTGVDLRPRPSELDPTIAWVTGRWDVQAHRWTGPAARRLATVDRPTLVIAHEWLDDLPCPLVRRVPDGWRELALAGEPAGTVDGEPLSGDSLAWARRWWPVGDRAEIGLTRDRAWAGLIDAVTPYGGCALMVDYGHLLGARPIHGTLAGYRAGRAVEPRPGPDTNLTAHVAVDAVQAAGEDRGATTVLRERQAEVVARLRPDRPHPGGRPPGRPGADPLTDLAVRSEWAALASRSVWGSFWWLLQDVS